MLIITIIVMLYIVFNTVVITIIIISMAFIIAVTIIILMIIDWCHHDCQHCFLFVIYVSVFLLISMMMVVYHHPRGRSKTIILILLDTFWGLTSIYHSCPSYLFGFTRGNHQPPTDSQPQLPRFVLRGHVPLRGHHRGQHPEAHAVVAVGL